MKSQQYIYKLIHPILRKAAKKSKMCDPTRSLLPLSTGKAKTTKITEVVWSQHTKEIIQSPCSFD